jgi:large subunit ribosomal protein L7/L12
MRSGFWPTSRTPSWAGRFETTSSTTAVLEDGGLVAALDPRGGGHGGIEAEGVAAAAQAKTTVDIKLLSFDAAAKIKVIKEVRSIISELGLKEAKELVESAPKILQKGVSVEKAEEFKKKLQEVGAEIELV